MLACVKMFTLLEIGANYGIPAFVIVLQWIWIWRQERRNQLLQNQLNAESGLRVDDAKKYLSLALDLQKQVATNVDRMHTTLATAANGPDYER